MFHIAGSNAEIHSFNSTVLLDASKYLSCVFSADVHTFNSLISAAPDVREKYNERWDLITVSLPLVLCVIRHVMVNNKVNNNDPSVWAPGFAEADESAESPAKPADVQCCP